MEYAGSYALYNYRLEDPSKGLEYDNIRLIRAFEHGLDPTSSEAGFVLVHIDMVKNSGPLVDGVVSALDACEHKDRAAFDAGMKKTVDSMEKINKVMDSKCITFLLSQPWIQAFSFCNVYNCMPLLTCCQLCGGRANRMITPPSVHSSLASLANLCSHMASCTKAYLRSLSHSVANLVQMTAWLVSISHQFPGSVH